ncbi:30S ribosomal protein S8 [Candidatus Gottesmanbacteria bacterium]|nr:30S ribosomal protein S8 [Candidatus Gottesmanbacteria bacterium]
MLTQEHDFLTQIKNGYLARLQTVELPYSSVKDRLAQILTKQGYLRESEVVAGSRKRLRVTLSYQEKMPVLTDVIRISKPGRRVYVKKHAIFPVIGGLGIAIVSTSKGFMIDKEAKRAGLGGELICKVW